MPLGHVLEGCRVLDFTQYLAGPTVTRLMAEMGAEVIKVEIAPTGDFTRLMPYERNGRSGYFIQQNRGKKSLCINPKDSRSLEILKGLVKQCDVLVENFSPGVIGRLGLGWDVVHELNPRLIMCSVSAFGQTGPLAKKPGFDFIAGSYAAVVGMIGDPNGPPYFPGLGVGDVSTGVHGFAGILAALLDRGRTGEGQFIDVSILDSYFHCHEMNVQMASASEGAIQPHRNGRHLWYVAPFGLFAAKDGYVFIAAIRDQWNSLCKAMGREDFLTDERFATNDARVAREKELEGLIEEWLGQFTVEEAVAMLDRHHVPAAPVLSVWEAMHHPHLIERGTIRTVTDPVFGSYQLPGMPIRLSNYPEQLPLTTSYLGEHNRELLTEYLGYTPQQVQELEEAGVLMAKPDLDRAEAAE